MNVVFTGAGRVAGVRVVRTQLAQLANENGFYVVNTVKPSTFYLVTDTPDSGTRKNRAAVKYGVLRISVEDFVNKCGGTVELREKDILS